MDARGLSGVFAEVAGAVGVVEDVVPEAVRFSQLHNNEASGNHNVSAGLSFDLTAAH